MKLSLSVLFLSFVYAQSNLQKLHKERIENEICEYNYEKQRLDIMFEYKLKTLDVVNLLMHYHEDVDSRPEEFTVSQHFNNLENFHMEISRIDEERDALLEKIEFLCVS